MKVFQGGKNTIFPKCFSVIIFVSMMRRARNISYNVSSFGIIIPYEYYKEISFQEQNVERANQMESRNSKIPLAIWMFVDGLELCLLLNKLNSCPISSPPLFWLIWSTRSLVAAIIAQLHIFSLKDFLHNSG